MKLITKQKIINVLAISSFVISGAVVGTGIYVYVNKASIIDGIKSKVMESVTGSLPDVMDQALPDVTGSVMPQAPKGLLP